jgi:capsular exopolysaccharide synthesis family protein
MPEDNFPRELLPTNGHQNRPQNQWTPPAPADFYRAPAYTLDIEPETPGVPLSHYFWILRRNGWKILTFVVISTIATLLISQRLIPVYESTSTVDIDRQLPAGIVGEDANRTALNDADQFLATQIKLIESDSVLRPVVDRYNLRKREAQSTTVPAGNTVPIQDAPVTLKNLRIVRSPNTYLLLISYRSTDPRLASDVANGIARSYLEHAYTIRFQSSANLASFMEKQLEELRAKMERSSAALAQCEKDFGVIDPEQKTSIVSARLLQLNTEYTNAQTDRVRKETAFKSVDTGTLEAAQVSSQGEALKKLTERIEDAQQKFAETKLHYGANHPEFKKSAGELAEVQRELQQARENISQRVQVEYQQALDREEMLQKAVAETKAEFDRLNAKSFDYMTLKREADADKKLYDELETKIKEAGINAGFQNSAIRIADNARPSVKPVFPNLKLNLALAFLFSSLLGICAAVVNDLLDRTVRDPEQVSRTLNTAVIGSLPAIKEIHAIPPAKTNGAGSLPTPHNLEKSEVTSYRESVRMLRNSILLADFDRRIRSLLVTSAGSGEGKSTIATHLAIAHAQQGRRTLLVDADLRRPSVHRLLGISSNAPGLSAVVTGDMPWRAAVHPMDSVPNLAILRAGPPSRRATDLVGNELPQILEEAGKDYDLIILDSPPLLGFPEPLQMATMVDGVLVIARSGFTNRKALGSVLNTLTRMRANIVGIALNQIHANSSEEYYYHYNHYYSPKYYQRYRAEEHKA